MSAPGPYNKTVFDVVELGPFDGYKLGSGLVVPRPIGWIGTLSPDGVPNLAPFSFFNMVSGVPPTFIFSPASGDRRDTLDNVRATGEFTINIVTAEVAEAMNATAASAPRDVDEFALAGVTALTATQIGAPMVGECKANIECRVTEIVQVGEPETGNAVVFGEAVVFHVADSLLDGTRVNQTELRAIGRHVGNTYSRSDDQFDIERPA